MPGPHGTAERGVTDLDSQSFYAEILRLEPDPDSVICWSLGGAGYVLKAAGTVIYVDPFLNPSYQDGTVSRAFAPPFLAEEIQRIDLLIITHDHADHCDPVTLKEAAARTACVLAGPRPAIELAEASGFPADRVHRLVAGDTFESQGAAVHVFAGADPNAPEALTYLLELEGLRLFFAGDSHPTDEFRRVSARFDVDIAFLATAGNPEGQHWYMDPPELVSVCRLLECGSLVAMHWDIWRELALDPGTVLAAIRSEAPDLSAYVLPCRQRVALTRRNSIDGDGISWSPAGA
jgi:L-ascorbate metabolism protein UlaG (beta-lactamase superfamily)